MTNYIIICVTLILEYTGYFSRRQLFSAPILGITITIVVLFTLILVFIFGCFIFKFRIVKDDSFMFTLKVGLNQSS